MSSNNPAPTPVQASVVEPVQDIKPLDFDTSAFTTTTTAQPEPSIEVQSLDFDISSLNTPTAEPTKPAEELKPLDFGSLSLESTPAQPAETAAADIQPLDFSFNLDTAPTTTPEAEISPPAADESVLNLHLIFQANPRLKLQKTSLLFLSIRLVQVKR